jgi:hypothetical protein
MPLLPEEDFTLHLSGQVDGEQFAHLFRQTWRHLPAGARHALIARWFYAAQKPRPLDVPAVPCFILAEYLKAPSGEDVAGLYLDRLNVFAWHSGTMGALDDSLVAAAIAHELAHAVVAEVSYPEMAHEHTIDMLITRWGFAGHELRALALEVRIEGRAASAMG